MVLFSFAYNLKLKVHQLVLYYVMRIYRGAFHCLLSVPFEKA